MRISPKLEMQKLQLAAKKGYERAQSTTENQRITLGAIGALVLLILISGSLQLQSLSAQRPTVANNPSDAGRVASLYLAAATPIDSRTQYLVGQRDSLDVMVDNGGVPLQEVTVQIHYPSHMITIDNINTNDSACIGVRNKTSEPNKGLISFACTIPTEAVTKQIGKLATIWFIAKAEGTANFSIIRETAHAKAVSATKNLADTREVLKSTRGITLGVVAREDRNATPVGVATLLTPDVDQPTPEKSFIPAPVSVVSTNYSPDELCTSALTTSFQWLTQVGVNRFEYSWGTQPDVADPPTQSVSTSIDLPTKPGDIYYFHIRSVAKNGNKGPVQRIIIPSCPSK